ncbi:MAG: hypothetical protein RIR77_1453 [Planctomycetota bacterium]|jgi:predicted  nucleic acid-binding Zn-ribbon protein
MSISVIIWLFILGLASGLACIGISVTTFLHARRIEADFCARLQGMATLEELKTAEGQLQALQSELVSMRAQESEARRLVADADVARAELASIRENLTALEPRRGELKSILERLAQARETLDRTESELAERRAAAAQAAVEEEWRKARLSQLETSIRDALLRVESVQAELAGLMAARAEAEQSVASLTASLEALSTRKRELEHELALLKAQVAEREEAARLLQRRIEDAQRQLEVAKLEERSARQHVAQLTAKAKELEEELKRSQRNLESVQSKLAELAPVTTTAKRFEAVFGKPPIGRHELLKKLTETDALKRVRDHAKSCGFVYSNRVLQAFHTSLKIDSRAPLMVLAGISGTGKTQLPRLYADALGINFLPVAVQPGWDSPQDLLGFFSHLEGRFRPTSLLQALVQMDGYIGSEALKREGFKELAKQWASNSCEDQMLLVLLDEMNLARVEYYFSDFLSKLELRNSPGFDAANAESRARASVFLEGGPGSDGIPVFAGHNVLFAGTMNEDESTQSLSDKVIDRANVMRFGTPTKLEAASATPTANDANPYRLSKDVWASWKVPAQKGAAIAGRPLDEWIADLNGALKPVHRPFGHRTAGAITEYVRQYPGAAKSAEAQKHALADQIEQRVMPKLRGLDPQSEEGMLAFGKICEIVTSIGDTRLVEAIRMGQASHGGSQFVWFGVDRGAD